MKRLLSADWHLDDQPENEYRWRVFDEVKRTCFSGGIKDLYMLGDLSDRKDHHSGALVNRLVDSFKDLVTNGISCVILAGNHDGPLTGDPYWSFLDDLEGVRFIVTPEVVCGALALPYSRDGIGKPPDLKHVHETDVILLHGLVQGARIQSRDLGGVPLPDWVRHARIVWAGDVHEPQTIGNLTYVGAPHPVAFGDTYPCGMWIVGEDWSPLQRVELHPPKKLVVGITSFSDLRTAGVQKGDQVRVRVELPNGQAAAWPGLEERIAFWARAKGATLVSTEVTFTGNAATSEEELVWRDPERVLEAFCRAQGIEGDIKEAGVAVVEEAVGQVEGSTGTRTSGMRKIGIKALALQDFGSFAAATGVSFPETPGLRIVTGRNLAEPRLGANGVGKSTLWEAVVFALTGTASDGTRGPGLTRYGAKRARVSVVLDVDGREVTIERASNPNLVLLDKNPIEQDAIDNLLCLTREQICHSIVFGQDVAQFYDLTSSERDRFLDDVLDLSVWTKCGEIVSRRLLTVDRSSQTLRLEKARLVGALEEVSEERERGLRAKSAAFEAERKGRLDDLNRQLQTAESAFEEAKAALQAAKDAKATYEQTRRVIPALSTAARDEERLLRSEVGGLEREMVSLEKAARFYADHEDCPTCHQHIGPDLRRRHLDEAARHRAESKKQLEDLRERIAALVERQVVERRAWEKARRDEERAEDKIERKYELATVVERNATVRRTELLASCAKEAARNDPFAGLIAEIARKRADLLTQERECTDALKVLEGEKLLTGKWAPLFKQVRGFVTERLLAVLSAETESAAAMLGMRGWHIVFTKERETKAGTTRPGIHIEVTQDGTARPRRSGGEKQRIRIAVSIGIANLIRRMKAVAPDFEVWDEPGSYLSDEGMEELIGVLDQRARVLRKKVWLIAHKHVQSSRITEGWCVTRNEDGSHVTDLGSV